MTGTELNEVLTRLELQRLELIPASSNRCTCRNYRRQMDMRKDDRLLQIITRHYVPHAGYVEWGFKGNTLLHSGKYIKYPKNSNCQRWIKRETSRRIRNSKDAPLKGNFYRRLFDYWWTLY